MTGAHEHLTGFIDIRSGRSSADEAAAHVDDVVRRTADPDFPYDPSAEWGGPGYREPRSDAEANARIAHLERERSDGPGPRPELRQPTHLEAALYDAQETAVLADLAHDPDPGAWARVADLEAQLDDERNHEQPVGSGGGLAHEQRVQGEDPGAGPALALEDAWFRSSLQDVVPVDTPDREVVIDRAVAYARERFVAHDEITFPEQALAHLATEQPTIEQERDEPELEKDETEIEEPEP